ncbi:hypothetical protein SOVF_041710 isoform A [Spinacia oleracea]|nr:hypothetical protein SOVF_041710 isoform A [Spinacia oleracea]
MPHYTSYKRHTSTYNYLSDIVLELLRREKRYGIQPDEDLDLLNKAEKTRIYAEYIMKGSTQCSNCQGTRFVRDG